MNSTESRTLWISVGVAVLSIFLLYGWSQEQKADLSRRFGATKVVVTASEDIAEMQTIDESKLTRAERPVDFIEPGAVLNPEDAIGQIAAVPIKKGEQLVETKLLPPGPETGLSVEVAPGKRAITIPIDDMRGVSHLLRPGDRIDLVAALDIGKGADQRREVRVILQNVVILATGLNVMNKIPRRFEVDPSGKTVNLLNLNLNTTFTTITVEVKPDEVQQLVYILSTSPGSLFTSLRHPNDPDIQPVRSISLEDVLGRSTVRAPAAVAPPVVSMPQPVTVQRPRVLPKRKRAGGFEEL